MPKINSDNINNSGNKIFVELFTKLIKQVQYDGDNKDLTKKEKTVYSFKIRHLKNALRVIKLFPNKINSTEDLEDIRGIGKGTLKRIEEILKTKKLKELRNDKKIKDNNKELEIIEELISVINIGRKVAKELVKKNNIKSVKDLKKKVKEKKIELNNKILLGLKYHGKVKLKIPRKETELYIKELEDTVKNISKDLNVIVCGSYRRKKVTSNDIDVLLTHNKINTEKQKEKSKINYLLEFVNMLKERNILKDDLTDGEIKTKYMGFSKLNRKPVRRIDIRFVPKRSYYPALLYFTGSYQLNQDMRQIAKSQGYKLNEYGLYKLIEKDGKTTEKFIKVKSEKNIFDKLGMDYVNPEERG
jgi:DNA polymerase/3'-5' exonuclease PolX